MSKHFVNRRFVRIKAMQQLYAFYVNRAANYQLALEGLATYFVPDIYSIVPANPEILLEECQKATAIFKTCVRNSTAPTSSQGSILIDKSVKYAYDTYTHLCRADIKKLDNAWELSFSTIQKIYLLMVQLLWEWFNHSHSHQADRLLEVPTTAQLHLTTSIILSKLKDHPDFNELVRIDKSTWESFHLLPLRWYKKFIKPLLELQQADATAIVSPNIILYLLDTVIFVEEEIQSFFYDMDIHWLEHKPLLQKLFQCVFAKLEIETILEKSKGIVDLSKQQADFYATLVQLVVAKEGDIDKLIDLHLDNWSLHRVVLLDGVIMKLAIAEMRYLRSVPIKVSINEYVELAKTYSTFKSASFINGILDAIAKVS